MVIDRVEPFDPNQYIAFDLLRANGYIGAKILGSAIIMKFISAYLGHYPWNCYYKDDYFDEFLLYPENKPEHVYFSKKSK